MILRKKEWTSWFVWSAVLIGSAGVLAHLATPGATDLTAAFWEYFPEGPWRRLSLGAGAVAIAGIVMTVAERISLGGRHPAEATLGSMAPQSIQATLEEVQQRVTACISGRTPNVSGAMDEVLRGALILNASDIHLNPLATAMKVTYRLDGVLYQVCQIDQEFGGRLTSRVKVLAYLDSFSKEPQDGSLRRRIGDVDLEARVSALPSNHGQRVVMRLVRGGEAVPALCDLGFDKPTTTKLEAVLQRPQGIFYVSGPVGSGKTTTLYSALHHLHGSRGETTSLVTLEDPIELQLPYATQTQINAKQGMSFAQTLRSVLRQDPGALMLGEIRDRETAEIATQAGLTGHLILTTIHVQSASSTFARLIEMDVEPFILASSCVGSLAQRLVRALCVECRKAVQPSPEIVSRFERMGIKIEAADYFEPVGCPICEGRGYSGRLPIVELLVMSDRIRSAVHERAPSEEIHCLALEEGMIPLVVSGLSLAQRGSTSLLEVLRVAG